MEFLTWLIENFVHIDKHLEALPASLGPWLYVVLFLVIFCETGLVVTPFLPGDSLLFALGALAARPEFGLNLSLLLILLLTAAILGDATNYYIGSRLGPRVFKCEKSRLFNKKHLLRTQRFYERYGGKTIVLARFIPIIRTFAPFVAGIGQMSYRQFSVYNICGAVAWILTFLLGGYYFGSTELVKKNFPIVIFAIIVISVLPAVIEFILAWRRSETLATTSKSDQLDLRSPAKMVSQEAK